MATASITAKLNQSLGDGRFSVDVNKGPDVIADAASVSTKIATALTAYDAFAAAVIAITGDTYSNTTHLFTFGGSTGLTHAQWATEGALLNTAISDFLLANTAASLVTTDLGADATLTINLANVTTLGKLTAVVRKLIERVPGLGLVS